MKLILAETQQKFVQRKLTALQVIKPGKTTNR